MVPGKVRLLVDRFQIHLLYLLAHSITFFRCPSVATSATSVPRAASRNFSLGVSGPYVTVRLWKEVWREEASRDPSLNLAFHLLKLTGLHGQSDALQHEPACLLGHAQRPVNLV